VRVIAEHHTDPSEAGRIFERVKPRLAVFSHFNAGAAILPLVRQSYSGPVELGEDLMTIEIGDSVTVKRPAPSIR
jgi:ribonuclease Z